MSIAPLELSSVINTDQARLYGSAIAAVKEEGTLRRRCRHRPVQYLNNILEQDHRAIKRRVKAKQSFREFQAARRPIEGKMKKKMGRAAPLIGFAFLLATIAMGCKKEPTTTTVPVPNAQGRPAVDFAKPAATGTTGGYGAVPFHWVLMVPPDS